MRYSFEEFMDMVKRYPALDEEMCYGAASRDYYLRGHKCEYPYVSIGRPNVCILADWEYYEDGDALIAESRFTTQGKPAARIIMQDDSRHITYNIRNANGEYGHDLQSCSDGANFNTVYSDMARIPELQFPAWDNSGAAQIFATLKNNGCLQNHGADFLYHDRGMGLVYGFNKMVIFGRENGSDFLVNKSWGTSIAYDRAVYLGNIAIHYTGDKTEITSLPNDAGQKTAICTTLLERIEAVKEISADEDIVFANTEDDSHIGMIYVEEKSASSHRPFTFWVLSERPSQGNAPYANVEHDNIVGRSASPRP